MDRALHEHQKAKYAWQILFVGANIDAVLSGSAFGVLRGQAMTFNASAAGVGNAFAATSCYLSQYRSVADVHVANALEFTAEDRVSSMMPDQPPIAGVIVSPTIPPTNNP